MFFQPTPACPKCGGEADDTIPLTNFRNVCSKCNIVFGWKTEIVKSPDGDLMDSLVGVLVDISTSKDEYMNVLEDSIAYNSRMIDEAKERIDRLRKVLGEEE
jgi:hypothetical protein